MKNYLLLTLFLSFVMVVLPFLSLSDNMGEKRLNPAKENEKVIVENTDTKAEIETDLFEYIVGSVAAEMPASFEAEALKAQAVASYTYKKYLSENGNSAVSSNPEIHQGYKTRDELKELWGEKYELYIEKIENAVESVFGEYLVSDEKTVPALYHALSPGMTESAELVFGNEVKALKSVVAPGDRLSPDYMSEKIFTKEEICTLAKSETTDGSIEITDSSDSRYVKSIVIFGKEYDGNEARKLLGLNSPYFTVEESDGKYKFTVYGKGHGVGMSQYSADYMARQGSTYKEILLHFYSDCSIVK